MSKDEMPGIGSSPATRRAALGMTAAMTAGLLAEKALSPDSARAEGVSSVNGKTGAVELPGLTSEGKLPTSVVISSTDPLTISGAPTAGEVLTATSGTTADWAVSAGGVTIIPGQSTAAGEGALKEFQLLSTIEKEVHDSNTAIGWLAMKAFTGLIGAYAPTSNTAIGSSVINLTGVEAKAGAVWEGGTSNTPIIVFRKLTSGVTGLAAGVAYFVVKGAANSFELALTKGGAGIKVAGHMLEAASTEIALLASAEDNTAIGAYALGALTTGGGNVGIGRNAGSELTTGEENIAIGCEALTRQTGVTGNVAVGFRALHSNTTGENDAYGYDALVTNTTGSGNLALGRRALEALTTGNNNIAVGAIAMGHATTAENNTAVGQRALSSLSTGAENAAVGFLSGESLTTGENNVLVGNFTLEQNKTGSKNVAIGHQAGAENTGSGNVFLGYEAGFKEKGSNKLYVANSSTVEPLILGEFPNASLVFNATKMGFFKKTAVSQPAKPTTLAEVITALETLGLVA